jgi:hypothetical protein
MLRGYYTPGKDSRESDGPRFSPTTNLLIVMKVSDQRGLAARAMVENGWIPGLRLGRPPE